MRGVVVAGALLTLVLACSGGLPRPPYAPQPSSALTVTDFPPPPPRVEVVPAQPADAAVWIDGEWSWNGSKWRWKPGRWVVPPPGAWFSPWTSVRDSDGALYFAPGAWRNARGEEVAEPAPLSYGAAGRGAVVDTEGEAEQTGPNLRPGAPLADGGS